MFFVLLAYVFVLFAYYTQLRYGMAKYMYDLVYPCCTGIANSYYSQYSVCCKTWRRI